MNPRRLNFEQYRDTLISLAGQLDTSMGGRAVEMFPLGVTSMRRSIYGMVDRQFIPSVMRMFDFANPDLHIPKRSETTVPQQRSFRSIIRLSLPDRERRQPDFQHQQPKPHPVLALQNFLKSSFSETPQHSKARRPLHFFSLQKPPR